MFGGRRHMPGQLRSCGEGVEMESTRGGVGGGSILQRRVVDGGTRCVGVCIGLRLRDGRRVG